MQEAIAFLKSLLKYFAVGLFIFWILAPICWIFISSIQPMVDLYSTPPNIIPKHPTLINYVNILFSPMKGSVTLRTSLINSLIVSTVATLVTMSLSSLVAYAFTRFKLLLKKYLYVMLLMMQTIPYIALAIPLYIIYNTLGLFDTYFGLILVESGIMVPYIIWFLRGYFGAVPVELDESAILDGSSRLGALLKIVIPLAAPGIAAVAAYCFIEIWNEFFFPLLLTSSLKTLQVMMGQYTGQYHIDLGLLNAACILSIIPVAILVFISSKYLIRGLLAGGLKE